MIFQSLHLSYIKTIIRSCHQVIRGYSMGRTEFHCHQRISLSQERKSVKMFSVCEVNSYVYFKSYGHSVK